MKTYIVTVRTDSATHQYSAIGSSSFDVQLAAMDRFGPFCKVIVKAT